MGQLTTLVKKKVENLKNLVTAPSPFALSVLLQKVSRLILQVSVSIRCDLTARQSDAALNRSNKEKYSTRTGREQLSVS